MNAFHTKPRYGVIFQSHWNVIREWSILLFYVDVGPAYVTGNPNVAIRTVNSLRAHGGGDCAEMAMNGLYLGIVRSLPNSDIYFFTDASAKDGHLLHAVISLALQKKCKIYPFIFGSCSRRRKRRSLSEQDPYELLATSTGGQYLEFSKRNIDDAIKLLRRPNATSTNSSLVYQEVTVMSVQVSNETTTNGKTYVVKCDSTIQSMTAVLSADGNASIVISGPPGNVSIAGIRNVCINERMGG